MPKVKGPDMMVIEADSLVESAWLPTAQILQRYDWDEVFGNLHPVEVELGSGDGGFILGRAASHPDRNFLAIERLLGRARKIAKRIRREERNNLKVLRLESSYVVQRLCPPQSVDVVHIMFPDPWPKKRHHKRRLIQPAFLDILHTVLRPGGTVRFSTDHEEYFQWAGEAWGAVKGWRKLPLWDFENDPATEFQIQWEEQGKTTFRAHWQAVD